MTSILPPDHVAKWSAPTAHHDDKSPPFACGPHVSNRASMDQAVLAQNGKILEAASGVCLLIVVYLAKLKLGAVIHLWRNHELWTEQQDLIRNVFTQFPQLSGNSYVGFVSNQNIEAELPELATAAKVLIRTLAPDARIEDVWVNSYDHPDVDPQEVDPDLIEMEYQMSVDVALGTAAGTLIIFDDFGETATIDLMS